jgi:DNA repair exonuclease SbcCD ATPase subunit
MQRKKQRPAGATVPVESLEAMQSELEAVRLEGQAIKEEWQQMNRRMQDAQQRLAAVEARNVFLEKADEARRLIHTDLRDTQRRLVETRDEHRRIQQESATRQLDLEQQVQDLRMIQDEVGHLLRTERAEKERLAKGQATAQQAAATAIARVGSLLESKALAEEEAAALAAELAAERGKESSLESEAQELRHQLEQLQRENDAKIAELVNHLDIVVGAVASHGRTMVRHAGGFAQLGTVVEHECKREEARRAALATADKRWASKVPDLVADTNRAAAAARNRGRVAFQPFATGSLYMR